MITLKISRRSILKSSRGIEKGFQRSGCGLNGDWTYSRGSDIYFGHHIQTGFDTHSSSYREGTEGFTPKWATFYSNTLTKDLIGKLDLRLHISIRLPSPVLIYIDKFTRVQTVSKFMTR